MRCTAGCRLVQWRGRRLQRPAAAGGVHRRRPEAEHLPLPPRRAARVHGCARVRRAGPGRRGAGMRPHAAQCRAGAGRRQPRVHGRGAQGAYAGFRPHTTEVQSPGELDGLYLLPDAADAAEALVEAEEASTWRPSLIEPRHALEEHRRAAEARNIARAVLALVQQHGVSPGQIFVLARKREPLRVLSAGLKRLGMPHAAPEDTPLLRCARCARPAGAAGCAGIAGPHAVAGACAAQPAAGRQRRRSAAAGRGGARRAHQLVVGLDEPGADLAAPRCCGRANCCAAGPRWRGACRRTICWTASCSKVN
jgi:hypothetical protein